MVGCLLFVLVSGLELLCFAVGSGLMESGAGPGAHRLWAQALWSIPLTGLPAAAGFARRSLALARILACAGTAAGAYWCWRSVTCKYHESWFVEGLVSAMAMTAALLLIGSAVATLAHRRA